MKAKFLTKLTFITSIKQGLSFQFNPTEKASNPKPEIPLFYLQEDLNHEEPEPPASEICSVEEEDDHPENDDEEEEQPCLSDFEAKLLPGGRESVVLYTTSLRGIRKTYEDCTAIKFLLESFKIAFYERDISMDMEFREELWRILGGRVIPPRLFIKGRYIGGADEVVGLNERGKLKKLMEGIPFLPSNSPCSFCANVRFMVCPYCNGGRKVLRDIRVAMKFTLDVQSVMKMGWSNASLAVEKLDY